MNKLKKVEKKADAFAIKWAEFVVKHKWLVLISTVLFAIGIASQGNMEFDADYHVFFSEENPELLAFDGLQEKYTKFAL